MLDFINHTCMISKFNLISDHESKDAFPQMKGMNIAISVMLINIV